MNCGTHQRQRLPCGYAVQPEVYELLRSHTAASAPPTGPMDALQGLPVHVVTGQRARSWVFYHRPTLLRYLDAQLPEACLPCFTKLITGTK